MPDIELDVLIIGAGVVGMSLASALLQGNMRVGLVEAIPKALAPIPRIETIPTPHQPPDLRVFALTRASEQFFEQIGIWQTIVNQGISAFRQMYVWDANGVGQIHFDSTLLNEPTLGYIAEHRVLNDALQSRLAQFDQLTYYCPTRVTAFQLVNREQSVNVHLDTGQVLNTRLLISAEGANASLRQLTNLPYTLHDYGQSAIVATVETTLPHLETAAQRFLSDGILAFLPLIDPQTSSIVWSVNTAKAQQLLALDTATFQTTLAEAFGWKRGNVLACSERRAFPLQRRYMQHYVQHRFAFLGDAAHTVHPLAGQGVNLGLLDAKVLSEVILEAYLKQRDFSHYHTLRRYERARKGHNLGVAFLMDGFKNLFGTSSPTLTWIRNAGLNLTDAVTPLKKGIMWQAMGL